MEGASIPEDLIIEKILPWLPAKSLVRFRSVCKAWNYEIPTRHFIELHRERSRPKIDLMPWMQGYRFVASSRHLIVLGYRNGYLLSNPATKDILHLPPASWYKALSSLGKYKLLSVSFGTGDTCTCDVFTVGIDDSWRTCKSPPFPVSTSHSMPYLNGNLHMLSLGSIDFSGFKDEIWRVLLPKEFELREIRGFLCFVCCIPGRTVDVWMMRDYANGVWSKYLVIDGTHLGIKKGLYGFPLEVMSDGRIFIEMDDGRWFYFDPKDGSFQLVGHPGRGARNAVYAENLVPILGF
uniref:F-box domain-containing protein n=1 Tax=Setaria viridis TaxID=4556 RepID=A0A4U6WEW1_SETVI|nr:hypothetical protein SEVIR_1G311800v2 [Setaria viridis]